MRGGRPRSRPGLLRGCYGAVGICLRGVLAVVTILAIAACLLLIRLSQGPISVPGIAALMVQQVNANSERSRVSVGDLVLSLGDGKAPSGLQFRDVVVTTPEGAPLFSAPRIAAAFELSDIVQGLIRPIRVTIVEPQLTFVRDDTGRVQVGMGMTDSQVPEAELSSDGDDGFDAITRIVDGFVGDQESVPELEKLDLIRVVDADLTYHDRIAGRSWRTRRAGMRISRYARGGRAVLTIDHLDGQSSGLSLRVLADRATGTGETLLTLQFGRVEGRELARQAPGLEWMELIDGVVEGQASAVVERSGTIRDLTGVAVLENGALALEGQKFAYDFVRLAFDVDAESLTLNVSDFTASADNLDVRLSAISQVLLDDAGAFSGIVVDAQLERLGLALPTVFEEDLAFGAGSVTARWDRDENAIRIASASLETQETTFNVTGRLQGADTGWAGDLRVAAEDATIQDILHIWPLDAAVNARAWVDENVLKAQIPELLMQVQISGGAPRLSLDFTFEDLDARYLAGMAPLQSMAGEGFLGAERLDLRVTEGYVAPSARDRITLAGSWVSITDFSAPTTNADIFVDGSGGIGSVLDLIDQKPLELVSKLGVDLGSTAGTTEIDARIAFPLINDLLLEQIDVTARAELFGFAMDYALNDSVTLALAAEELVLVADTRELSVDGAIAIDGVPSTVAWAEFYGNGEGRRTLNLTSVGSEALLAQFGIADSPLTGDLPFDLELTQTEGAAPRIRIDADLSDATLALPALGWEKPPGTPGDLLVDLTPDDKIVLHRLRLDTPDLDVDGSVMFDAAGVFESAEFQRIELRRTLNIAATVQRSGTDAYTVTVDGDHLNLSRLMEQLPDDEGAAQENGAAVDVRFNIDRLVPSDDIEILDARGTYTRDRRGNARAAATGSLNGAADLSATLARDASGKGNLVIESADAAGVLETVDLYDDAEGGKLTITADIDPESNIAGIVRIQDLSIKSDPSIQSALRGNGLNEIESEIERTGISFRKIWIPFRMQDGDIVLTDAIASSSAIALKVNGTINSVSDELNLRGVISPAYGLTGALDNVPLLGTLLSGGEGEGILAMTFTLSGATKDPNFTVNPLSLLTPGFLRNVFERGSREPSDGFRRQLRGQDR